jgi:hypothetical protein
MKLYELKRVEQVEATAAFKAEEEKSASRRRAARKAVLTKWEKTMEYVENEVKTRLPCMSKERLIARACQHYNNQKVARAEWCGHGWTGNDATKESDPFFLERIAVNYLRHELTGYDFHLDHLRGKVGIDDAYMAIRAGIFAAIAKEYPWLAKECKRQRDKERNAV